MNNLEYYNTLGIDLNSTPQQIRQAYKDKALETHPDKNPDNKEETKELFKKVSEAYSVLKDVNKRQIYDKYGKEGLQPQGQNLPNQNFQQNNARFGQMPQYFRPMGQMPQQFSRQQYFGNNDNFTFSRAEQLFKETFGEEELKQAGFVNIDFYPFQGGQRTQQQLTSGSQQNRQIVPQNINPHQIQMMGGMMGGPPHVMQMMGEMQMMGGFGMFGDDMDMEVIGYGFGFGMMDMDQMLGGDPFQMIQQQIGSNLMMGLNQQGVQGQSFSQSTIIQNGKQVSVSKSNTFNGDGTQMSNVREFVRDGNRIIKDESYNPNTYKQYTQPKAIQNFQPQSQIQTAIQPQRLIQNVIQPQRQIQNVIQPQRQIQTSIQPMRRIQTQMQPQRLIQSQIQNIPIQRPSNNIIYRR